jgi:hypothetical protein
LGHEKNQKIRLQKTLVYCTPTGIHRLLATGIVRVSFENFSIARPGRLNRNGVLIQQLVFWPQIADGGSGSSEVRLELDFDNDCAGRKSDSIELKQCGG